MSILDDIKALTGNKPKDEKPAPPPTPQKTILIVEDEKPLANILGDRLTAEGYHVVKAANGEEGLKAVQESQPAAVLLDLLMPVMGGIEMLNRLRQIPKFKLLPVIVLTNAGEVDNIQNTVTYNDAVEFLIKSNVSLETIVEKVKSVAW